MKRNLQTLLAMGAIALSAHAVPAEPGLTFVTNPDGSEVAVRLFGDEFFSFATDAEGDYILERDESGFLVPAIRGGHMLRANSEDIEILRNETAIANPRIDVPGTMMRLPELDNLGRSKFPTIGSPKGVVILMEYADTKFTVPDIRENITRLCNEPGYSSYGSCGSVKDYFEATSNGLFSPEFDVYGPITLPETSKYYTGGMKMLKFHEAVAFAVKALDDEIDYAQYDTDGDGVIDNVFFYFAGFGQNDTHDESTVWPHQNDYRYSVRDGKADDIIVDGVQMGTYACSSELKKTIPEGMQQPWLDGIGTFVHEFGHVLGLPDLYDVEAFLVSTQAPLYWSVMDAGSYNIFGTCPPRYSTYEQWVCHWADFEEAVIGETYTLESISESKTPRALSIRVPKKGGNDYHNEWFILETRSGRGWDAGLSEKGLAIWHINYDANKWANNRVNIDRDPHWHLVQPSKTSSQYSWPGNNGLYTFVCPDVTQGISPSNSSTGFPIYIDGISYDDETQTTTFGLGRVTTRPSTRTSLHEISKIDHDLRNFTLEWDPVEGATGYLLTVSLMDDDWKRYVNDYNETPVGNVTSVTLENVMEKFWSMTITASVRAVHELPSTRISNSLRFVPKDIKPEGVEDVVIALPSVSGAYGCIIAPEGARVYDLQGRLREADGLERGVYIVVVGEKAHKVTVK